MLLRGPGAASYRPRKLQWEGEEVDGGRGQEDGKRGQGKKKRRVRKKGHARQGSKSSLQEIRWLQWFSAVQSCIVGPDPSP